MQKFFGDAFGGMLLHDFWTAYRSTDVARQQYYLVHLLREVEEVDEHHAARSSTTSRTPDDRPTPGGPPSPSGCYA